MQIVYAYVGGNPISRLDWLGLKPGDSFPTAEAAAIDAINYLNTKADCVTNEFFGWVYQEWSLFGQGGYTYDEPTELSKTGSNNAPPPPLYHNYNAMYHNHPLIPGGYSDYYSPADKKTADAFKVPSYLEIPSGQILRYTPDPQSPMGGKQDQIGTAATKCSCANH
jgi:hypothetical protein